MDNENLPVETGKKSLWDKIRLPKIKWSWKLLLTSFLPVGILLFLIDLLSKWLVVWNLGIVSPSGEIYGSSVPVIEGFFYISLSFNEGMAFGLGADDLWARILFIVASFLGSGLLLYFWLRHLSKGKTFENFIFALLFAGALGNGIDRAFYWKPIVGFSGVVDFFQFYIFGPNAKPFATFNVADACLSVGLVLAIILIIINSFKGDEHVEEGK